MIRYCWIKLSITFCILFLLTTQTKAQEAQEKSTEYSGQVMMRYIRTDNREPLRTFDILSHYGFIKAKHELTDWLSIGGQANFLFQYGTGGIAPDAVTGSGPIYEGNIWNTRLMDGSFEFALPALYMHLDFGKHQVELGQFVKFTSSINGEAWPFPNAMRGAWYQFRGKKSNFQLGWITDIAPRQSGRFAGIGATLGQAGVGFNPDGSVSGYRDNVDSNYMVIFNADVKLGERANLDIWNYYTNNVYNSLLLEPSWKSKDESWLLKAMFIYQTRINRGGSLIPNLTYFTNAEATSLGFRAEKRVANDLFQLNFTRISDYGRLLFPREWGLEPFYTFQRRTRIEGGKDATAIMGKWQRTWENDKMNSRLYASLGKTWMPAADDFERNKNILPSFMHLDLSYRYEPKGKLKNFWIEGYTAYRFLNGDAAGFPSYINRVEFFHLDLMLGWRF